MRVFLSSTCKDVKSHRAMLDAWFSRVIRNFLLENSRQTQDDILSQVALKLRAALFEHEQWESADAPQIVYIDGQYKVFVNGKPLINSVSLREQAHMHLDVVAALFDSIDKLLNLTLFVAALIFVFEYLFALVVPIRGVTTLREKIKSLSLPKNLFPQSLRPIESLAH